MLSRFAGRVAALGVILALGAAAISAEPTRSAKQTAIYCTRNGAGGVTPGGRGNVAGGTDSGVLSGGGSPFNAAGNQACDLDSVIAGGAGNVIFRNRIDSGEAAAAFIGAGGNNVVDATDGFIGAGTSNIVRGSAGFIGNGADNTAAGTFSFVGAGNSSLAEGTGSFVGAGENGNVFGDNSFVGAGVDNAVTGPFAFVGSGVANSVGAFPGGVPDRTAAQYGAIAGGQGNRVSQNWGFIGGGSGNVVSARYGVVAGGSENTARGLGAAVPGGQNNLASGVDSFSGGTGSNAADDGAFVWSDDAPGAKPLRSTARNQFLVRSSGGVAFYTGAALEAGVTLAPGGGSWASLSDRASKTGIAPLDGERVLAKVAVLPLSEWSYRSEDPHVRHLGPMAQDFFAAFGVGEDDRHITAIDADGVALAAIQGLCRLQHRENAELRKALATRDAEIAALDRRVDALAAQVASLPRGH